MPPDGDPRWSVVVPTRDRPDQLRRCLRALLALRGVEPDPELVVVDDDPAGSAREVVTQAGPRVRYIGASGQGPAAARNLGAAAAGGELLAFTDDDCEPEPDWLASLGAALGSDRGAAAAGSTLNAAAELPSRASQLVVSALQGAQRHRGGPAFVASNNVAFPRAPLRALGGFNESFPLAAAEDRDLCERWLEAGHRFVDAPGARVRHRHRLSLPGFWRQHFRYGRGARAFHRARRRRGRGRMRLQPGFYAALAAELREADRDRVRLAALVGLSQIANGAGYAAESMRPDSGGR